MLTKSKERQDYMSDGSKEGKERQGVREQSHADCNDDGHFPGGETANDKLGLRTICQNPKENKIIQVMDQRKDKEK
jgi:hypothetical protein